MRTSTRSIGTNLAAGKGLPLSISTYCDTGHVYRSETHGVLHVFPGVVKLTIAPMHPQQAVGVRSSKQPDVRRE